MAVGVVVESPNEEGYGYLVRGRGHHTFTIIRTRTEYFAPNKKHNCSFVRLY